MQSWPLSDSFPEQLPAPSVALTTVPSGALWANMAIPVQHPVYMHSTLAQVPPGAPHVPSSYPFPHTTVVPLTAQKQIVQAPVLIAPQCQTPQEIASGCMSSDYENCSNGACQNRCIKALRDSANGTTFRGWSGDPGYDSGICRAQNACMDPDWRNYYCSSSQVRQRNRMVGNNISAY